MARTRTTPTHPFAGARRMKPTQKHRPAIWEAMLGTVEAMNPDGKVKYFDYDWDAARAYAEVDAPEADPRVARTPSPARCRYSNDSSRDPRPGQFALWVLR